MSRRSRREETVPEQGEPQGAASRKRPTIIPYLAILVLAAFLLLVMAYLMQLRTAQSVEGLNQSMNTIQSFDQLVEDNRTLHQRVDALEEELDASESQRQALEDQLEAANAQLSQVQGELDALRAQASPSPAP